MAVVENASRQFFGNRDGFLLAFHWQQESPVHVGACRNIPYISRSSVIPDHAVREHGEIVSRRVPYCAKGAAAIDGVADDQITLVVDSGPGGRKDPRLRHVIAQRIRFLFSDRRERVPESLFVDTHPLGDGQQQVAEVRPGVDRAMVHADSVAIALETFNLPIEVHMTTMPKTELGTARQYERQAGRPVAVAVGQTTTVKRNGRIEQRSIAVRSFGKSAQKVSELSVVEFVTPRQMFECFLVAVVVRE